MQWKGLVWLLLVPLGISLSSGIYDELRNSRNLSVGQARQEMMQARADYEQKIRRIRCKIKDETYYQRLCRGTR
jgi:outer membrane protein TolC